jgi:hypothetical protein
MDKFSEGVLSLAGASSKTGIVVSPAELNIYGPFFRDRNSSVLPVK